jgi:superfamily II DNA or RNA helicase
MKSWHPYGSDIDLWVKKRGIAQADAQRQRLTAQEILRRLYQRPGVILADEVGMGKTFVALAVAASVSLSDSRRRPVVVMVPPSLRDKWPLDFSVFESECLPKHMRGQLRSATADTAADFLKLIDDPISRRASIIFLTHGAMHRGLQRGNAGGWIKLAVIQRALHRRQNLNPLRRSLYRRLGELLEMSWVQRRKPELWRLLLDRSTTAWHRVLVRSGIAEEREDDPVPMAVVHALDRLSSRKLDQVMEALQAVPVRNSGRYAERIKDARETLNQAVKELWRECLRHLSFKLPLLILDEAHHLKNPQTRFASLFQDSDAQQDAQVFGGELNAVFERMLFLTATPFQLGHHELCEVLNRFGSINWSGSQAPQCGGEHFATCLEQLRSSLDAAKAAALRFDLAWGKLAAQDLIVGQHHFESVDRWWAHIEGHPTANPNAEAVLDCYSESTKHMRLAEESLRPWVIRHLRSRTLDGRFHGRLRRKRLPGISIRTDNYHPSEPGLELPGSAELPFLLAARATINSPESRPVFAEGLASSYEAFLYTSRRRRKVSAGMDDDAEHYQPSALTDTTAWYLNRLEAVLPLRDHRDSAAHPKINATAERVVETWRRGEKLVVFCHFIETGRALRRAISGLMHNEILRLGSRKLRCSTADAARQLELMGKRFFDIDSPIRKACDQEIDKLLRQFPGIPNRNKLKETIRRYLRTPSFLVRFVPLTRSGLKVRAIHNAFHGDTPSGLSLRQVLEGFLNFLENQCSSDTEREAYIDEVSSTQTGEMIARKDLFDREELDGKQTRCLLLPNVRLVNGDSNPVTRRRLMMTFNSPFFPEVLIASSVMAEGVDLHRFCRFVIHHDLDWNPSSWEQRTGRLDRIGARVEQCGEPIHVYLPYLAGTQDEKMYRVVMDRERWFNVVMGEQFKVDARSTETLAQRIRLPESVAKSLAFRLEVRPI